MYRVTVEIASKDLLVQTLECLMVDGVSITGLSLVASQTVIKEASPARNIGAYVLKKAKRQPKPSRIKRINQSMNRNGEKIMEIIRTTFGPGTVFSPKQIVSLVEARGIDRTSFYQCMAGLARAGMLGHPKAGQYVLNQAGVTQ